MRARFISFVVMLAALTLGCGPQDGGRDSLGETVRIPGTQVRLAPAEGFTLASAFPGFEHKGVKASVTITEVPSPYDQLVTAMSPEVLGPRGMKVNGMKEVTAAGFDAKLLSVTNNNQGIEFDNRMLLVGNDSKALLIVAAHPDPIPAEMAQQLEASLLSLQWDPDEVVDPFDGLGFRVPETDTVAVQRRIWNGLILRVAGQRGNVFLFFSKVPPEIPISDVEQFSIQRLKSLGELKDLGEIDGEAVEVASMQGYEIVGNAKDVESGNPIVVYQMVLANESGAFLIGAIVGAEGSEEYVEKFRATARSLERTS